MKTNSLKNKRSKSNTNNDDDDTESSFLTLSEVKSMKVAQLRSALLARNMSTSGLKADLMSRLIEIVEKEEKEREEETIKTVDNNNNNNNDDDEFEDCGEPEQEEKQEVDSENKTLLDLHSEEEIVNLTKTLCQHMTSWKPVFEAYLPLLVQGAVVLRKMLHTTCSTNSQFSSDVNTSKVQVTLAECLSELLRFEESVDLISTSLWPASSSSTTQGQQPNIQTQLQAPNLNDHCTADRLKGALTSLMKAEARINLPGEDKTALVSSFSKLNLLKQNVAIIAIKFSEQILSHSSSISPPNNNDESLSMKFNLTLSLYKDVEKFQHICEGSTSARSGEEGIKTTPITFNGNVEAALIAFNQKKTSFSSSQEDEKNHKNKLIRFAPFQFSSMTLEMADVVTLLDESLSHVLSTPPVVPQGDAHDGSGDDNRDEQVDVVDKKLDLDYYLNHARSVCLNSIGHVDAQKSCDVLFDVSAVWEALSPSPLTTSGNILTQAPPIIDRCRVLSEALVFSAACGPKLEETQYILTKVEGEKLAQERELRSALVHRDRYAEKVAMLEEAKMILEEKQANMDIDSLPQVQDLKRKLNQALQANQKLFESNLNKGDTASSASSKLSANTSSSQVLEVLADVKHDASIKPELSKGTVKLHHDNVELEASSLAALRRARTESAVWRRRACRSLMSGLRPLPSLSGPQTPASILDHTLISKSDCVSITSDSPSLSSNNAVLKLRDLEKKVIRAAASVTVVSLVGTSKSFPVDLSSSPSKEEYKTNDDNIVPSPEAQVIGMTTDALKLKAEYESFCLNNFHFSKRSFPIRQQRHQMLEEESSYVVGKLTLHGVNSDYGVPKSGKVVVSKSDIGELAKAIAV